MATCASTSTRKIGRWAFELTLGLPVGRGQAIGGSRRAQSWTRIGSLSLRAQIVRKRKNRAPLAARAERKPAGAPVARSPTGVPSRR